MKGDRRFARSFDWPIPTLVLMLLIDLAWGLTLVYRIPPFGGTDEAYHWLRAEEISFGEFLPIKRGANDLGGTVDLRSIKLMTYFGTRFARDRPADRHEAQALATELQAAPEARAVISFPSTAEYAPLAYLPAAAGITLARWCKLDLLAQLHAGRIGGLLCFLALTGLVAFLLPIGRYAALALLGMPGALGEAATINADPMNLILPTVLVAWVMRLMLRPDMPYGRPQQTGMAALATSLGLLKILAVIFSPVVLLIPVQRFSSARARLTFVAICAVASLTVGVLWTATFPLIPGVYWKTGANPGAALHAIVTQPVHRITIMVQRLFIALPDLWQSSYGRIGTHRYSGGAYHPPNLGFLALPCMLVLALNGRPMRARPAAACWLALLSIAYVFMLALAFRITYNAPLDDGVGELTGRYLNVAEVMLMLAISLVPPWRREHRARAGLLATALVLVLAVQAQTIRVTLGWLSQTWQ